MGHSLKTPLPQLSLSLYDVFFSLINNIMCPIQNYLLSLRLTEYKPSFLQVVKLVQAVQQSMADNCEFAQAALAWVERNNCNSMITNEYTLMTFLLDLLCYKLRV